MIFSNGTDIIVFTPQMKQQRLMKYVHFVLTSMQKNMTLQEVFTGT